MNPFKREGAIAATDEMCSDVAPFILDKLDPAVKAMIDHAAARQRVKSDRLIEAIIADREAQDAMP